MAKIEHLHRLPFPYEILRRELQTFLAPCLNEAIVFIKRTLGHEFADFIVISDDFAQERDIFQRSELLTRLYLEYWSNAGYEGEKPLISLVGMTRYEATARQYL